MNVFKIYTQNEMAEKLIDNHYPTYLKENGYTSFEGMWYLNSDLFYTFNEEDAKNMYLVCENKEGKILGVIQLAKKALTEHNKNFSLNFNDKKTLSYILIYFIDVHKDFRKQGIATQLYKELNKLLQPNQYVVGTGMSNSGKMANVHGLRKKYITNGINFGDIYEFNDFFETI